MSSLSLAAVQALLKYFETVTDHELMPGVVAVIQTFGDRINFHPHIHVLISEGGTAPDGAFHRVCRFHDEVIQEIFTHEVFARVTSHIPDKGQVMVRYYGLYSNAHRGKMRKAGPK